MDIKGKVAVITGGASGIGRATALKFAAEGAAGVVVADLNEEALKTVADQVGGLAVRCDVGREDDIKRLVAEAEKRYGRIDVFFSNAGILGRGGPEAPDELWDAMWRIHVMAHVSGGARGGRADAGARRGAVRDHRLGGGAAEHRRVGALWRHQACRGGLRRMGCRSPTDAAGWTCPACARRRCAPAWSRTTTAAPAGVDGVLSADTVADEVLRTMRERRFLVLPHPQVLDYMRNKTADYDRWLGGTRRSST